MTGFVGQVGMLPNVLLPWHWESMRSENSYTAMSCPFASKYSLDPNKRVGGPLSERYTPTQWSAYTVPKPGSLHRVFHRSTLSLYAGHFPPFRRQYSGTDPMQGTQAILSRVPQPITLPPSQACLYSVAARARSFGTPLPKR